MTRFNLQLHTIKSTNNIGWNVNPKKSSFFERYVEIEWRGKQVDDVMLIVSNLIFCVKKISVDGSLSTQKDLKIFVREYQANMAWKNQSRDDKPRVLQTFFLYTRISFHPTFVQKSLLMIKLNLCSYIIKLIYIVIFCCHAQWACSLCQTWNEILCNLHVDYLWDDLGFSNASLGIVDCGFTETQVFK